MALVEHPINRLTNLAIGAAIEVHRQLGPGLLESCYQACLERELKLRNIGYRSQVPLPLMYKGIHVGRAYVLDVLIEEELIIEIKAVERLMPVFTAQLMTYMRLQAVTAGLLMNFNVPILPKGIRRILL